MDSFIVQPIPRRPYAIPLPSPIVSATSSLLSDPVVDAVARISIADSHTPSQDDPSTQPFSLSDDALEEFLGILRPAFPPRSTSSASSTSPSIRTTSYSRPHPYRSGRPVPGSSSSADDVLVRSRKSSAKECRKRLSMSVDTSIVLGDLVDGPDHPSSSHTRAWRASRSIRASHPFRSPILHLTPHPQ
ncbi:hypothetical protein BS47DRAFT_1338772 [Hydnum rufescens UP504]|uniref:Uncharacterized protein n=1 Tax=Hydnum rufescens UP504 TaxID=1448309 RepID=A0A9P6B5K8_9AGAM|nr:hypothetical protein BS47DRAFT_1338772 [Hydnum rufescens UP504]